mmetsp:Transcript_40714/g.88191  ORF Transcript_40714/g.88191 Transcript_40714/m.88191 type:complete len:216 (-) Transcript_40714:1600-2247(-)
MSGHLHDELVVLQCLAALHDAHNHGLHEVLAVLFHGGRNICTSRSIGALSCEVGFTTQLDQRDLDPHEFALKLRIHHKLVAVLRIFLLFIWISSHQYFGLGIDVKAHQMPFQLLQGNVASHLQVLVSQGDVLVEEHQDAHLISCDVQFMLRLWHLSLDVGETVLWLPKELSTCVLCQVEGFESAAAVLNFRRQLAGGARRAWPKAASQHRHLQIN